MLRSTQRGRLGLTLVELMVVVAVLGVLASLLLPAVQAARGAARRTGCLSQLREIGVATRLYADARGGRLPRSSHSAAAVGEPPWAWALAETLDPAFDLDRDPYPLALMDGLYRCPEDERTGWREYSYGKNVWFELARSELDALSSIDDRTRRPRLDLVPAPSKTVWMAEVGKRQDHLMAHFWGEGGQVEVDASRHGGLGNYLWLDGRATTGAFIQTYDPPNDVDRWNPNEAGRVATRG
ncbi:MAG: DUF1559 domain-containing protein [Planctomycetota bacterium]